MPSKRCSTVSSSSPKTASFPFQSIKQQHLQASILKPYCTSTTPSGSSTSCPPATPSFFRLKLHFSKISYLLPHPQSHRPPLAAATITWRRCLPTPRFLPPRPLPRPPIISATVYKRIVRSRYDSEECVGFISSLSKNAAGHAFPVFGRKEVGECLWRWTAFLPCMTQFEKCAWLHLPQPPPFLTVTRFSP